VSKYSVEEPTALGQSQVRAAAYSCRPTPGTAPLDMDAHQRIMWCACVRVCVCVLRTLDTTARALLLRVVGNELAEPPRKLESRCAHGVSKRHRAKYERTSVQGEWNLG
jgi:hypothetical protein